MQYTTILIDLDHTLLDSDASERAAFEQAMAVAGVATHEQYIADFQRINISLWAAVERGEMTPQLVRTRRFELLVEEAGFDVDPLPIADAYVAGLAANGGLYDGARDVLEYLSGHAALALVTNGLSEVQRARIARLDIGRYFKSIVISAEVGTAKPHAKIFDIVFDELGSPSRSSALMVGDSLSSDIRGGADYGVATCWYNPAGKAAGPADRVSHQVRELAELRQFAGPPRAGNRS